MRVFVQVGAGSLNAFVDDSLAGHLHNALSVLGPQRDALEQLQWVAAALFVEGANLELSRLGLAAPAATRSRQVKVQLGVPLIRLETAPPPSTPVHPAPAAPVETSAPPLLERTETRTLSVDAFPELLDHCLYRQPADWPEVADRAPAVPMTMSLELMREAAEALLPGKVTVGFEKVLASSWLLAAPPVEVTITAKQVDSERVRVTLGQYVQGTVLLADEYPSPPVLPRTVKNHQTIVVTGQAIYRDRWMFHGPAYQGLASVDASDSTGARGTLVNLPAKGALLDAAGQLAGLWVMLKAETDRLSMPVRVERIEFYSPPPPVNASVECEAVIRSFGQREVRSDIKLWYDSTPYCSISLWENWRFDTDGGLFDMMRFPERNLLAEVHPEGFVTLATRDQSLAALMSLAGRFIPATSLDEFRTQPNRRKQSEWLFGRIAAKDAVRSYLFDQGYGAIYPLDIGIEHDATGKPLVKSKIDRDLRVSISHTEGMVAAIALEGADPGIDIERIAPRTENFGAIAFTRDELAMLPEANRDEWMTRLWSAKEATGKARGTGLQGSPRTLPLQAIKGTRMLIDGTWVSTRRIGQYVVAWTGS